MIRLLVKGVFRRTAAVPAAVFRWRGFAEDRSDIFRQLVKPDSETPVSAADMPEPVPEAKTIKSRPESFSTFHMLADILGKRYYPHNEEVKFEADAKVRAYDANEKMLGEISFAAAQTMAANEGLDLVLKTTSSLIPVVQIAPYRAELIKKFYEKYTQLKLVEDTVEDDDFTEMELHQNIDISDLRNKITMITQQVRKKNAAIRVIVKVDPNNKIEVAKANFLLQNVADQLAGVGIVKKKPNVQDLPDYVVTASSQIGAKPYQRAGYGDEQEADMGASDKRRHERKAVESVPTGFVCVDIIPQTNKQTAASIEGIMKGLGSVEDILKQIQARRTTYATGRENVDVGAEVRAAKRLRGRFPRRLPRSSSRPERRRRTTWNARGKERCGKE